MLTVFFKSNGGAACTCVATEYHYHDNENFAIEVEQFTADELSTQLLRFLRSYRYYHFNRATIEQQDDLRDAEQSADIAIQTFRAMFNKRLEDEQFLVRRSEETVVASLQSWAAELAPPTLSRQEFGEADCSSRLMQLTSDQSVDQGVAEWPYIKKIKY